MVEWSLPRRNNLPEAHGFQAELRTDVSGFGDSVVIQARPGEPALEPARDELDSTVRARGAGS